MSTRAMIDVVNRDTGETIRLYSGHDSYPSGTLTETTFCIRQLEQEKIIKEMTA